jgi:hypothetical protein
MVIFSKGMIELMLTYNYKIMHSCKYKVGLKYSPNVGLSISLLVFGCSMIAFALLCFCFGHNFAFGSFQGQIGTKLIQVSDLLTYDDTINGFSLKYPSDWQLVQHIDRSVSFIAPREGAADIYPAGFAIMVKKVPVNLSLSTITQKQLETLRGLYPDIHILETSDIIFLGQPAHRIVFTATDTTGHLRKAMQIWFKEDTKTFLFTYKSNVEVFPKYLSTIELMLNSFYTLNTGSGSSS